MLEAGVDIAPASLIAGLPIGQGGLLSPQLAVRAAERAGFRATLTRRKLADLPDAVLPVVLFLKDRGACVLLSRDGAERATVVWPERASDRLSVPISELNDAYIGHALLLKADVANTEEGRVDPARGHWLWSHIRRYWPAYLQVALASALVNVLALATPLFTMNVYDRVFPNAALVTLWSLVAGVGLALTFDAVLKWLRARVVDRTGRQIDLAVSSAIFGHLSNLRADTSPVRTGHLANTLKDYEQVVEFFSSQTLATLMDLAFAVLFLAVIAYIGGPLVWPPAIALGVVFVVGLGSLWPLRRSAQASRAAGGAKTAVAVESLSEPETLKAVSGHGRMQGRWEKQVADAAITQSQSRSIATFATTITGLAQQGASVGIVIVGVYLALEGQITMGAVIAAMILSSRALAPTAALSSLFVRGSFAFSTLKSLNQYMRMPSDAEGRQMRAGDGAGALQLDGVSVTYPGAQVPALEGITISIKAGERVALIGPVGSGKSSLVRVLGGLWPPTQGLALLDGLNVAQLAPAALRQQVQVVQQEAILFSGTLAENIAFGRNGATEAEVLAAARAAGVDRIAAEHPDGFSMQIDERGRNLSGGQRQLVALARALIQRPRVLILDEPTSAMDMQSERILIERLQALADSTRMTLVIATHRMGLLDLTDRTILLSRGKVYLDGPKQDVLARLEPTAEGR
ncbi:MAG: type I secretion system permease/ATPase [Rhodobacteraceae bacterium]|nr:type I secretion system permease/ATPase [Paracoccaceae bacterium]